MIKIALQTKTFSSPTTSNGYTLTLTLKENSIDIDKNLSPVSYALVLKSGNASFSQFRTGWSVSLGGAVVSSKAKADAPQISLGRNSSVTIASGSVNIRHNADGKKKMSVAFSIDMNKASYTPGAISVSGQSMTLTTIPRATKPTLPSSIEMGERITVTLPRASTAFTHELSYSFGAASGLIGKNYGASAVWTVPLSLAEQIPSAKSGNGTVTCKTYNGATLIGTSSVSFTANVPSTVVPTISGIDISETVSEISEHFGTFVQERSKVRVKTTAQGAYKSKISAVKISFCGKEYKGVDIVTDSPTSAGKIAVNITVTDSRGRTAKKSQSIEIIPYSPPTVNSFTAKRADITGLEDDEGEYMAYSADYAISSVNNLNNAVFQIQYKRVSDTQWNILLTETEYAKVFSGVSEQNILNSDNPYNVRLLVKDFFEPVYFSVTDIPTAFTLADYDTSGQGLAFGAVSRGKGMHIHLPVDFYGELLADFVIEQGAQGIWTYRKWSSGIAECFGRSSVETEFTNKWGQNYVSNEMTPLINYPFKFIERPVETAQLTFDKYAVWTCSDATRLNTAEHCGQYKGMRGTAITTANLMYVDFLVKGRWK